MSGPVTAYVRQLVAHRLTEHGVVVWYDAGGDFGALARGFASASCTVISAGDSELRARRNADQAIRRARASADVVPPTVLVHVPVARGGNDIARRADPFAGHANCAGMIGGLDGEQFRELVIRALPGREAEIDRLFSTGRPSLDTVDTLVSGSVNPRLMQVFGTTSPEAIVISCLVIAGTGDGIAGLAGSHADLEGALQSAIGLPGAPAGCRWADWRDQLADYVVLSDFVADIGGALPPAFSAIPHAPPAVQTTIRAIVQGLAGRDAGREVLMASAARVESRLGLPAMLGTDPPIGSLETFSWQERASLRSAVTIASGPHPDLSVVRAECLRASVWRTDPDRKAVWSIVSRAVAFLEAVEETSAGVPQASWPVKRHVEAYIEPTGRWQIDRAQRELEHLFACIDHVPELTPLLETCRRRYRETIDPPQTAFQEAVRRDGWPPAGLRRTTATYDEIVGPELASGGKVAYFLVDSLRYEMGRSLSEILADLGACDVESTAGLPPMYTDLGMAALVPGASAGLELRELNGSLVPFLHDRAVRSVDERRTVFESHLGTRVTDLPLQDVRTLTDVQLANRIRDVDLVVVRVQEIDDAGESQNQLRARREMTWTLQRDLRAAALRLIRNGFLVQVFASDHGHVQFPEVLASDVLPSPAGDWKLEKRRVRIGAPTHDRHGIVVLEPHSVGLVTSEPALAFAKGFATFGRGTGYSHEGLSLQECVLPVVTLRARSQPASGGDTPTVTLEYRSASFTSAVVSVKACLTSPRIPFLNVRIEAYDGRGRNAVCLGTARDCDGLDPNTGEVRLLTGQEVSVPLMIPTIQGSRSIEIRIIDPRTLVTYARLTLADKRLD